MTHLIYDNDYTFEEKLIWLGEISRYNIVCGTYGDEKWQVWNADGKYVEYEEYLQHIDVYKQEIDRLKA